MNPDAASPPRLRSGDRAWRARRTGKADQRASSRWQYAEFWRRLLRLAGRGGTNPSGSTHAEGRKAEQRAANWLRLRGYRLRERNLRTPWGEVDLVAEKGGVLVFVEVKARRTADRGAPLEALPPPKVRRLSRAAAAYVASRFRVPPRVRFDVVALGPQKDWLGRLKVQHLPNAFEPVENFTV